MALKISILFALVCIGVLISMSEAAPSRNDDYDVTARLEDAKKQFDALAKKMEDLAKILPAIHKLSDFNVERKFTGLQGLPQKPK